MSLRVFDFRCSNGHVSEQFVESGTAAVQCPHCEQLAYRLIAMPRVQLEGISGDFPGAAMAWEKRRESHMAKERKNQEKHGTYK